MTVHLRPMSAHEAETLTALAIRSKAHWGYDAEFMRACADELRVDAGDPVIVAELGGNIAGFACLRPAAQDAELDSLYVDPAHMWLGIGRALFKHCAEAARSTGAVRLLIDVDPHAEAFYTRMGAAVIGRAPSGSIPDRFLPRMAMSL